MQLFSFDIKDIFLSLIFFIGSCESFGPPEPVKVQTPKTVTLEKVGFEPGLEIKIQKNKKISMIYKHADKRISKIEIKDSDQKEIERGIQKAIDLSENKDKMKVRLISSADIEYKDFKIVIDALRTKNLYKYRLITDPE